MRTLALITSTIAERLGQSTWTNQSIDVITMLDLCIYLPEKEIVKQKKKLADVWLIEMPWKDNIIKLTSDNWMWSILRFRLRMCCVLVLDLPRFPSVFECRRQKAAEKRPLLHRWTLEHFRQIGTLIECSKSDLLQLLFFPFSISISVRASLVYVGWH